MARSKSLRGASIDWFLWLEGASHYREATLRPDGTYWLYFSSGSFLQRLIPREARLAPLQKEPLLCWIQDCRPSRIYD